jgi:deoxyribonuclease V
MRIRQLHGWELSPREAVRLQADLAGRVLELPTNPRGIRRIAGCDIAVAGDTLVASVVVMSADASEVLEIADAESPARFPYVPGLLSFREIPALLEAFARLRRRPDIVLCDGQGRAHPRRCGLASHLGLILDMPTIGVAKSRLCGEAGDPAATRGSWSPLIDRGERIGVVLRTRDSVRPLFVSVGHRVTIEDAIRIVLATGRGRRLPEPTRLADLRVRAAAREKRRRDALPLAACGAKHGDPIE